MQATDGGFGSTPAEITYRELRRLSGAKRPSNVQRIRDKAPSTKIKIGKVMAEVFTGSTPYWFLILLVMALCAFFPGLVTFLPELIK